MAQMSQAGDLTSGPMLKKIILFSCRWRHQLPAAFQCCCRCGRGGPVQPARWQQLVPTVRINLLVNLFVGALRWVQKCCGGPLWRKMTRACTETVQTAVALSLVGGAC